MEIPKNFSPSTSGNDSPSSSSGSGGGSGGNSVKRPDNQSASKNGPRISNSDGGQIDSLLDELRQCQTVTQAKELTPRLRDRLQHVRGVNDVDMERFRSNLSRIENATDVRTVHDRVDEIRSYWDDYRKATAA